MTLIAAVSASSSFLAQLMNPAARALALAAVAGLGLAGFRVKNTSVRLFSWTAVLYAAFAMPLLGRMLPTLPVATPEFLRMALFPERAEQVLPPHQGVSKVTVVSDGGRTGGFFVAHREAAQSTSSARAVRVEYPAAPSVSQWSSMWSSIDWSAVAAGIYVAVALLLLLRFFIGLALGHRLLRASQRIEESRVMQRLASRAYGLGLAVIPQAAESELISVPVTMGALRATILLPAGWREWDDAKLDAVIVHEVSHVARRDALTQRISLLHRAVFWFSPLSWWLNRHLADLAEQASDEAALSCGTNHRDYARILLGFFEALQAAPGRVWWQGVSMAKAGQAEQRVERILSWKGSVAMRLKKSIAVAVISLAVPVVFLVASVHPAGYAAEAQLRHFAQQQMPPTPTPKAQPSVTPDPGSEAPEAIVPDDSQEDSTPAPRVLVDPVPGVPPRAVVGPVPPMVPPVGRVTVYPAMAAKAPLPPVPPVARRGQSRGSGSSHGGFAYRYGDDDEQRFVIVSGKSDSLTMSGTGEDARHVEKLRKSIQGDFIWFQRDEKSYIIRDQATVDRAKKFWAEEEELGKKQAELGEEQEKLGKQQEELGEKMEQVHVSVPDMTAQLDKLKAELKALSSGATIEQVGHIQEEIGELQSKLGEIEAQAGGKQGELGRLQGELGEKQGKLGEQQGELGEKQAELAEKASRQMKALLDEAIAKGLAQPEL